MYHHLPPLLSSLFRILSYIFLRIIPTRLGQPVLPVLYLLYLLTSHFLPPPPPPPPSKDEDNKNPIEDGKKDDVKEFKTPDPWSILCFSLQTHNVKLRLSNIFINTLLLAAVLDVTLTPFIDAAHDVAFTRVGAVYPDSVKIQVRNPSNDTLVILYREASPVPSSSPLEWKHGPTFQPQEQFDWVETVRLPNLWPSTQYEYTVASINNSTLCFPKAPISFHTFPDPRLHMGKRLRFIASSCVSPNVPYRGPWHKNTIRGFDLLADYLQESSAQPVKMAMNETNMTNTTIPTDLPNQTPTDFLIFLGDFVYADVPVYVGDSRAGYQRLYRRNYLSPSFRKVYEKLPIIHAYDDHEFVNNYAGNSHDIAPYVNASAAYNIYAGNPNYDPIHPGQTYYSFQHGDIAFFVMDTRRYRSPVKDTEWDNRTMLGDEQLTSLYKWLNLANSTSSFKFIVSSVPFTSLWRHDAQHDSWAAYPKEKAALLEAFHSVPNVVVISGDRHEFAVIEFNSPDTKYGHIVREISTSPLSMFYIPFFRTLQPHSSQTFIRNVTVADNVTEEVEVPYERAIVYLPKGNTKWSTFDLDTSNSKRPVLNLETVIDGKPTYHLEIIGVPSQLSSTSIGSLLSTNIKDLFEKIGLKPSRWF